MKKTFHLKFGSQLPIEQVASILADRLDLKFEKHNSSYLGAYVLYRGMHADNLTVVSNHLPSDDWIAPTHKEAITIIDVTLNEGKNRDKEAKQKNILNWFRQIDAIFLIDSQAVETPD